MHISDVDSYEENQKYSKTNIAAKVYSMNRSHVGWTHTFLCLWQRLYDQSDILASYASIFKCSVDPELILMEYYASKNRSHLTDEFPETE